MYVTTANTVSGIPARRGKNTLKIKTKSPKDGSKSGQKQKNVKKVKKNLSFKNTHQEFNTKNENNSTLFLLARVKIRLQRCWLNVSPWNQWHEMASTRTGDRGRPRPLPNPSFWLDILSPCLFNLFADRFRALATAVAAHWWRHSCMLINWLPDGTYDTASLWL